MKIKELPPRIFNRISAGEVVEKPANVVKELVENSLDAQATKIKVEIFGGGITKIVVSDNGSGLEKDDLPLAFLPHATSKIAEVDDLDSIETLGFRGEALASISAVSMVKLVTKTDASPIGYQIEATGGEISKITEVARETGTTITVSNLFFNTPARKKFLRKVKTEEGDITHLIERLILSRPEIGFEYYVDGEQVYSHEQSDLADAIYVVYGADIYSKRLEVNEQSDACHVTGYIIGPRYTRPNRGYQSLFVNGRYVENYVISACVQGAYESMIAKGRFPIYVLNITLPYDKVDVNIHPNKREVKFVDNSKVLQTVRKAVENALINSNFMAEWEFTNKDEKDWEKYSKENDDDIRATNFDAPKQAVDFQSNGDEPKFVKVDDLDYVEKYLDPKNMPKELSKKGIETINMPDFSNIKADERKRNKPGGYIYFDQETEKLLTRDDIEKIDKQTRIDMVDITSEEREEKEVRAQAPSTASVQDSFLSADIADEIKIVGVVFKTYIITEYADSIYIIDQHAMHERQLYDILKKQVDEGNILKQDLLVPYTFSLNATDGVNFLEKAEHLNKIGFTIENKGNTFEIYSVPAVIANISLADFVDEILADDTSKERNASAFINEKLCQTACKHAIRAGDEINKGQIAYLIDQMRKGVLLCPHGRPMIAKITKKDLEKIFLRVV